MAWRSLASDADLRKRVLPQNDDVYSLAWAPGGHLLAAGSVNHVTCVWDVERRSVVGSLREHTHFVQARRTLLISLLKLFYRSTTVIF